jgi:putative hydrolase of the HAD superfamily
MLSPGIRQQIITSIRQNSRPILPVATGMTPHLPKLPGIRCVGLDVYGTLFVSAAGEITAGSDRSGAAPSSREELRSEAFRMVAESLGIEPEGAPEIARAFAASVATRHAEGHRNGIAQPEVDVLAVWREVLAGARAGPPSVSIPEIATRFELMVNPVWPMPGATEVLARLRERGFAVAIVSNAQFYTPLVWEALLGAAPEAMGITPRIWSWERGVAKPSAEIFAALTTDLAGRGISPGETLYLGNDMLNDVAAAKREGLKTALFAGDRRSLRMREHHPSVTGVHPDAVLTDLTQLMEVLPPMKGRNA